MKSLTFFALCAALSFFTACKKDEKAEIDSRDQFVGTWVGKITTKIPDISYDKTEADITKIAKDDKTTNKIKIIDPTDNSVHALGTVNGNSVAFDALTYENTFEGKSLKMTVNYTATIDGKILKAKGAIKSLYDGKSNDGAWEGTWTKQ